MTDDTVELNVNTRQLEAALQALPKTLAGQIMHDALQAGGNVLLRAIVALTPERTDEEVPASLESWRGYSGTGTTSLPPGILKADMHTEIQMGKGSLPPRVKVGPSTIASHVARWQNNGWNLTKGGQRHVDKRGRAHGSGKVIRAIPGKHFMEAGFDESADKALEAFVDALASGLSFEGVGPDNDSHDVEFG